MVCWRLSETHRTKVVSQTSSVSSPTPNDRGRRPHRREPRLPLFQGKAGRRSSRGRELWAGRAQSRLRRELGPSKGCGQTAGLSTAWQFPPRSGGEVLPGQLADVGPGGSLPAAGPVTSGPSPASRLRGGPGAGGACRGHRGCPGGASRFGSGVTGAAYNLPVQQTGRAFAA